MLIAAELYLSTIAPSSHQHSIKPAGKKKGGHWKPNPGPPALAATAGAMTTELRLPIAAQAISL